MRLTPKPNLAHTLPIFTELYNEEKVKHTLNAREIGALNILNNSMPKSFTNKIQYTDWEGGGGYTSVV